jgi:iron-sulfur cluster insertion protein
MNTVILTEKAVSEIKHIMTEQNMDANVSYVRVGVKGGGCSGFQWVFNIDENYNETTDVIEEQDGLKLVIDKRSMMYLAGTTVDFHNTLDKRGFKFENPSVRTSCGCGSSFSM